MPIYEFACLNCKTEFELLLRGEEKPDCPHCDNPKLEKKLSVISTPTESKSSGESCGLPQCGPAVG